MDEQTGNDGDCPAGDGGGTQGSDDDSSLRRLFQASKPTLPRASMITWLPDGTKLQGGRIEVARRLGSGAVGIVYEALDRGTPIAFKTLVNLSPEQLYRLKQEFRSLTSVVHPNVVVVYDLFAEPDAWYFTMELIRGVPLSEYWSRREASGGERRRDVSDGAQLRDQLRQLIEGVCAIHDAGLLHRDLKPNNIMVESGGRVVILDFGLVSDQLPGGAGQTLKHVISGTPGYMAPEQAAGLPATTASDWYAVGVILYQLLTERLPYQGNALEVLREKQQSDVPRVRSIAKDAPEDLDALCTALLARRPEARPTTEQMRALARSFHPCPPQNLPASLAVRTSASFVGRHAVLSRLVGLFRESRRGRPVLALIRAESGMGKSELLHAFVDSLQRQEDCFVIRGRCYERESVPYKALDEVVDDLTRILLRLSEEQIAQLLPRQAYALTRLFPVLSRLDAFRRATHAQLDCPEGHLQRLGFGALREMLCRIADRRPLVLAIDDLHWGDVDSIRLLREVLAPPEPPRLFVVGTCRSDEKHDALLRPLVGMSEVVVDQIELGPLTAQEAVELAQSTLSEAGDPARQLAQRIAQEAHGIPLYVIELARGQAELDTRDERASLDQLIGLRVARLPQDSRTILELAALSGGPLPRHVMQHACPSGACHSAVAQLRAARLIKAASGADGATDEAIEPYHEQVRLAVLARLRAATVLDLHRRLAEALEASGASDLESLARHLHGAGEHERARHFASAAASEAMQVFAFNRAAELFALAIELSGFERDPTLHRKLATALAGAGRGAESAEAYLVAAERSAPAEAPQLQALAAAQWLRVGHVECAVNLLRGVLARQGLRWPQTVSESVARFAVNRARIRVFGIKFTIRDESQVPRELLNKLDALYPAQTVLGTFDYLRGACFASVALPLALKAGEPKRLVNALASEAIYTIMLDAFGGVPRANAIRERMNAISASMEDPYVLAVTRLTAGLCAYWAGHWNRVLEPCTKAEELFTERVFGGTWESVLARSVRHTVAVHAAAVPQLMAEVPRALLDAEARSDRYAQLDLLRSRVTTLLIADRVQDAIGELERIDALLRRFPVTSINHLIASANVATNLYAGRAEEARRQLDARWQQCRKVGLHHFPLLRLTQIGMAADCARAQTQRPCDEQAQELFRLSRMAAREPVAWGQALSRSIEGVAWALQDETRRAFNAFDQAAELFQSVGMLLDAACARYEQAACAPAFNAKDLREEAAAFFETQGIKRPQRFVPIVHSLF